MMTFLVVANFILNASFLDNKRLGKQRIECLQILKAIEQGTGAWSNHPITLMWKNHIPALKYYTNCIIDEWIKRGFDNHIALFELPKIVIYPWWADWDRLHQSHRAMLLRKDPFYYKGKFTVESEYINHGYIWANNLTPNDKNKSLTEIAAPIPKNLINARFCPAIIKRSGLPCNILLKEGKDYCGRHK